MIRKVSEFARLLFPDVKSNRAKRQEISSEDQKVAELSKTIGKCLVVNLRE
jgi:hypothetical protein